MFEMVKINTTLRFTGVSAGGTGHSLAVADDGSLWSWGFGEGEGELGIPPNNIPFGYFGPFSVHVENVKFVAVSAGTAHSVALDVDGNVWTFGNNSYGQLGLGAEVQSQCIPNVIPTLKNIREIASGSVHVLALDIEGNVWMFGAIEQNPKNATPVNIFQQSQKIAVGARHNLILDSHSKVWSFGKNDSGQLGLNDTEERTEPVLIEELNNIISIYCGAASSFVTDSMGNVYVFGSNKQNQLAMPESKDYLVPAENPQLNHMEIFPCGMHTFCSNSSGQLFGFGLNDCGQLGVMANLGYAQGGPPHVIPHPILPFTLIPNVHVKSSQFPILVKSARNTHGSPTP